MRSAVRLWVVGVAMFLAACGGSEEPANAVLEHRRLVFPWGYNDAIKDYVVRDGSAWEAAWRENEPLVWPPDERPTIDFERNQVLGLTRGVSGGCNGMGIERVVEEPRRLRVEYKYYGPSPSESSSSQPTLFICPTVVVPLADFVVVPAADKPVVFVRVPS